MPVSKMETLRQSLQKQDLNTIQTTPSVVEGQQLLQESLQIHQNVQKYRHLHGLRRKFNSTTKQTELEGKVSYNSFDSNIELIDDFQNLKDRKFEFTNQENYVSVKGKFKQNQSF